MYFAAILVGRLVPSVWQTAIAGALLAIAGGSHPDDLGKITWRTHTSSRIPFVPEQTRPTLENLRIEGFRLSLGIDGLLYFYSGYTSAGPFERCPTNIGLHKDLFRAIDCERLISEDGNAASAAKQVGRPVLRPYWRLCLQLY